ncbi:hypothetical protein [Kingella potus]|uniref:hypothetical protein n=1 Tax=Kingella potus TaxID=265175 RepID=UPI001FD13619|nr:hypothetical protein [Kingella potus]UOP00881.1 hypothetical protein LVJ84_00090 [Kingella potus]
MLRSGFAFPKGQTAQYIRPSENTVSAKQNGITDFQTASCNTAAAFPATPLRSQRDGRQQLPAAAVFRYSPPFPQPKPVRP